MKNIQKIIDDNIKNNTIINIIVNKKDDYIYEFNGKKAIIFSYDIDGSNKKILKSKFII
jgi:hypothetical protein